MTAGIKCPLANEFKVACEIYKAEIESGPIEVPKLFERLEGKLDKKTINNALSTLFDWGMIKIEYGLTEDHSSGAHLRIDSWHQDRIRELYEHYWKVA